MSLLLPDADAAWKLAVNTNYQDVMKTFMNLVTASLVLPLFLVRNLLGVPEGQPITNYLRRSAYSSWGSLLLSLVCCMAFFLASAKYVKVVSGGGATELPLTASTFERVRDWSAAGSVLFFLAGLLFLVWYFAHDIRKG